MGKKFVPITEKQRKYLKYLLDKYKEYIEEKEIEEINNHINSYSKSEASRIIDHILWNNTPEGKERKAKLEEEAKKRHLEAIATFKTELGLSDKEFKLLKTEGYYDNDVECKGDESCCENLPLWLGFKLTGRYKKNKDSIYYIYRLPSDQSKFFIVHSSRCYGWSDYLSAFNMNMTAQECCDRASYYFHYNHIVDRTEDSGITLEKLKELPEAEVLYYNDKLCKADPDKGIIGCKTGDIITHKLFGKGQVEYRVFDTEDTISVRWFDENFCDDYIKPFACDILEVQPMPPYSTTETQEKVREIINQYRKSIN